MMDSFGHDRIDDRDDQAVKGKSAIDGAPHIENKMSSTGVPVMPSRRPCGGHFDGFAASQAAMSASISQA